MPCSLLPSALLLSLQMLDSECVVTVQHDHLWDPPASHFMQTNCAH